VYHELTKQPEPGSRILYKDAEQKRKPESEKGITYEDTLNAPTRSQSIADAILEEERVKAEEVTSRAAGMLRSTSSSRSEAAGLLVNRMVDLDQLRKQVSANPDLTDADKQRVDNALLFEKEAHGRVSSIYQGQVRDELTGPQPQQGSTRTSVPAAAWASVIVFGFKAGESAEDAAEQAAKLGMTNRRDCKERKDNRRSVPEYIDCEFLGNNGESIRASFYMGQLQRIEYKFPITQYNAILEKLETSFGTPRALTDPHDSSYLVSQEWGGYAENFNISLAKTADGTSARASTVFSPLR
jgi:hypothetical protein